MFNIEKTEKEIMNLFALISAIKAAADIPDGTVAKADECYDTILGLTDIAKEKLHFVWGNVSEVESKTHTIAEMISFLITDESVPAKISDSLADALSELETSAADNSPEYIAKVLESLSDE